MKVNEVANDQRLRKAIDHLRQGAEIRLLAVETCISDLMSAVDMITNAFRLGNRLFLCGNGGSAADCQHMAAELTSRLSAGFERPGLPAVALTTDTSFITGYSNDYGFEGVFERQLQSLGRQGDVVLGISTSGESENVLRAMRWGVEAGMNRIGLLGEGGRLAAEVDVAIRVPSHETAIIQEVHLSIEHIICHLVERDLFGSEGNQQ